MSLDMEWEENLPMKKQKKQNKAKQNKQKQLQKQQGKKPFSIKILKIKYPAS